MKCILANPGRSSVEPQDGAGNTFPIMNLVIPIINPTTSPDNAPVDVRPGHRIPRVKTIVMGGERYDWMVWM